MLSQHNIQRTMVIKKMLAAAAGHFCNACACRNCQNTQSNKDVVLQVRQQILARSPNAFEDKVRS